MPNALPILPSCPTCGRLFRPRPAPVAELPPEQLARMTDEAVAEYFKSTAPMKDVEFFLRHAAFTPELREMGEELLALLRRQNGAPSAETRRRYSRLHQTWREQAQAFAALRGPDAPPAPAKKARKKARKAAAVTALAPDLAADLVAEDVAS